MSTIRLPEYHEGTDAARRFDEGVRQILSVPRAILERRAGYVIVELVEPRLTPRTALISGLAARTAGPVLF